MAELAQTAREPAEDDDATASEDTEADADSFLADCVRKFNRADEAETVNRQKALDDIRFKAGEQWPEAIRSQRTIEQRPCLTVNKMKTFVHQITNDQRQNRPAINISPIGDKSDPQTAEMLKGLIRQIERTSNADVAYDTGFESAVTMGWGYWRILTDYEDDKTFNQVIKIGRIRNPFRVYIDPDSEEPDGSDAKWCFITDLILKDEFKDRWPEAQSTIAWMEGGIGDNYKNWITPTHVRVAEYFYYDTDIRTLVHLKNGHVGYEDELDPSLQALIAKDPEQIVNEREVECKTIKWCFITAQDVLEESDWAGNYIPVVKVIGDEADIEGKVSYAGIVRDAKDPQRMYNFWVTSETELIALAPKAPWIMEEGQVEGHEKMWRQANTKSLPYLTYKGTNIAGKPSPPPQRQQFAGPPTGIVQAKIAAAQDMQAATGIRFDATLQERTYDESGKALRELKRVGDLGNFHYVDNLSRSLKHTGTILIDLIPKIYDTARVVTILREDNSEEVVKIDPAAQQNGQEDLPDGRTMQLYNPNVGKYAVAVTVGPSFATKRAEAADSMLQFMKVVPASGPLIGDLIAKNMDWPGAEEISSRMASLLPPQLLDKKLDQLPTEAKALVSSLMQQMEQLKKEHDQAVAMLGDKNADRAIEQDKVDKNFEAAMAKVLADVETKMAALKQPIEDLTRKYDNEAQKIDNDFTAQLMGIVSDAEQHRLELESKEGIAGAQMQSDQQTAGAQMATDATLATNQQAQDKELAVAGQQQEKELAQGDQAIKKKAASAVPAGGMARLKKLEDTLAKVLDKLEKQDKASFEFVKDRKNDKWVAKRVVKH